VPAERVAEGVRRVAVERPDAIAILCTNLRGAEVAESLEAELEMPVLDSVVVGLWGAMQLLSMATPGRGFGRLQGLAMTDGLGPHA
jgi:maleate isomerase